MSFSRIPKITGGPGNLAISVEWLTSHLRFDIGDEDSLIMGYIQAATDYWQKYTNQLFITQEVTQKFSCFEEMLSTPLYWWPVQDIESITYIKTDNSESVDIKSLFELNDYADPVYICLADDASTPTDLKTGQNVITLKYNAGYGDTDIDIPHNIRQAIRLEASRHFSQRVNEQQSREMSSLAHQLMSLEKRKV